MKHHRFFHFKHIRPSLVGLILSPLFIAGLITSLLAVRQRQELRQQAKEKIKNVSPIECKVDSNCQSGFVCINNLCTPETSKTSAASEPETSDSCLSPNMQVVTGTNPNKLSPGNQTYPVSSTIYANAVSTDGKLYEVIVRPQSTWPANNPVWRWCSNDKSLPNLAACPLAFPSQIVLSNNESVIRIEARNVAGNGRHTAVGGNACRFTTDVTFSSTSPSPSPAPSPSPSPQPSPSLLPSPSPSASPSSPPLPSPPSGSPIATLFGDFNSDGKLNLLDYNLFITAMLTYLNTNIYPTATPQFSPFDLNQDYKINLLDYNLFLTALVRYTETNP